MGKNDEKLFEELYESWECGNQRYIKAKMKHKSKKFFINFIRHIAQNGYAEKAIDIAWKMVRD